MIAQAKAKDPQLGADLEREVALLSARRAFGLNFERHRPEAVELPGRPVRKGDQVRVLPPRGEVGKGDQRLWAVRGFETVAGARVARLELVAGGALETLSVAVADLVVVAGFYDSLYPGLVSTGRVARGGDRPCHTVINAENYLALEALGYTHRGRIDAIYIDPPYNTGARDWKYNNDYVEAEDLYRHSKWLAMMERRLLMARDLLNPANSVLIVTIDEKEYLRLGLLLEQTFPEGRIQMVASVVNRKGVPRRKEFSRVDEYLFFTFLGDSGPCRHFHDMLSDPRPSPIDGEEVTWIGLRRRGSEWRRSDRPGSFYPIFVNLKTAQIEAIGEPLPLTCSRDVVPDRPGCLTIWPLNRKGDESRWQLSPANLSSMLEQGDVRTSFQRNGQDVRLEYLSEGHRSQIADGTIHVVGHDDHKSKIVRFAGGRLQQAKTIWNQDAHGATAYGTQLVSALLGGRRFPYPKSLYAVEDTLRFFVKDKPNAIILDFFAGSGTTAHAVMRLNRQDGGQRQCLSITNNEVAADEHRALREQGLRPGDPDWERLGICEHITKPRIRAAITGQTPDGAPIAGDYKFTDEFPMAEGFAENAEFFTLSFETPVAVSHNRAFARIAPLLWLRAGSQGRRIDTLPETGWAVVERYGLLTDLDQAGAFCAAAAELAGLRLAFIVTNDDRRFQAAARQLPAGVEPVRLYESYLANFRLTQGA
ncbi:MAG TPA: DNA methyltransferase [Lamprocystis sp. (in: g-proteobacteria)]|nr:DNA methyltransferase [Lamprocystis sp. (in: g-proteobacteria)]